MFEKKEGEEPIQAETTIGASVKLEGDLASDGDIFLHGNVSGKVSTKADLTIGETAKVSADVEAKNVSISGKVDGNIKADGKVEITPSGVVKGDITTGDLMIASGSSFTGNCEMGEPSAESESSEDAKEEPAGE